MKQQIISIEVEDKPGVLMRVASLFSRRGFNIVSLTVGNTHKPGFSRFTIAFLGNDQDLEQLRKQAQKLIHVITTLNIDENNAVIREFSIVKVKKNEENSRTIDRIIDFFGLQVLYTDDSKYILELSGSEDKVNQVKEEIGFDNIIEFIRTGKVVIPIDNLF